MNSDEREIYTKHAKNAWVSFHDEGLMIHILYSDRKANIYQENYIKSCLGVIFNVVSN